MKRLKHIMAIFVLMITILLIESNVKANVQAIPTNKYEGTIYLPTKHFELIRKMETSAGPMGLNADVDETGTETSTSNNIDVHMIKNTEWGAMAMLMNSNYGSKASGSSEDYTTTGNASGIFAITNSSEYVAGLNCQYESSSVNTQRLNIINADRKYWNNYEEATGFVGDATTETPRWRNASLCRFTWNSKPWGNNQYTGVYVRGYDSVFCFYDGFNEGASRAAVVCGGGF